VAGRAGEGGSENLARFCHLPRLDTPDENQAAERHSTRLTGGLGTRSGSGAGTGR
jgi:hypothetical protein